MAALAAVIMLGTGCGTPSRAASTAGESVIAKVGSISITQHQFDIRYQSALTAVAQGGAPTPSGPGDPMARRLQASVLRGLIIDAVIAEEAARGGLTVSAAEIDKEVAADARAAGGTAKLQTALAEAGGSLESLRDETRARLTEQRVEDRFASERAGVVISALQGGQPFSALASQYSDDETTRDKGGDAGPTTLDLLRANDPTLLAALLALAPGGQVTAPVRDRAGYEIVQLDARSTTTVAFHRILVAAPNPYTVRERPRWFADSTLQGLAEDCQMGRVTVTLTGAPPPCISATASPSGTGR